MTEPYSFRRLSEKSSLDEPISLLLYGGSGTGKTWVMGTAGSRALIINCGRGIKTLESPLFIEKIGKIDPIVVDIQEKLGARGIVEDAVAYDAICDSIDHALREFPDDFDWVIIDEVTSLRRFAMNKALEVNAASGKSKTLESAKHSGAIMPAIQDWGAEMSLILQMCDGYINICKEAGKHFVMVAHERISYKKKKPSDPLIEDKIRPGFTGQTFPDDITALFDDCWRMECRSGSVYRAVLEGDEIITAKTRHGGIWQRIVTFPNLSVMLAKMQSIKPSSS